VALGSGSLIRFGEEAIMGSLSGVRVSGPLAPVADGFRSELVRRGYSPFVAVGHMQLLRHLSGWLGEGRDLVLPLSFGEIEGYLGARREAGYRRFLTVRSARPLLEFLRRQGVVDASGSRDAVPADEATALLVRFAEYLRAERGLAEVTIERPVWLARQILVAWEQAGRAELRDLTAADVTAFVLDSSRAGNGSVSGVVTALRSLLRFLHLAGVIDHPLAAAVPALASWKLAGLPKAVPAQQVTAMLAACNRDSVVGRRDGAILTLLARLGLRAGEVAGLGLDDLDWRSGEITVRGKGNRSERLPLPSDVGAALATYLTDGHPGTMAAQGRVFARLRAPHGPLTRGAVTQIVFRAADRAGLEPFFAHRLRHTARCDCSTPEWTAP
jgi:integrase/recombinase XerD